MRLLMYFSEPFCKKETVFWMFSLWVTQSRKISKFSNLSAILKHRGKNFVRMTSINRHALSSSLSTQSKCKSTSSLSVQSKCENNLGCYITNQIDSMFLCICSVIDHRRRQNVIRTSLTHSAITSCTTVLFLPHFDVICDLLLNRRMATWNLYFC